MFVLKGRVAHEPPYTGQGRIGVRVSVRSATRGAVADNRVLAGALISDDVLLRAGRREIEQAMSDAAVSRDMETAPTPGGTLPFQTVFFDTIGAITSYELAAETVKREARADGGPGGRASNPSCRGVGKDWRAVPDENGHYWDETFAFC